MKPSVILRGIAAGLLTVLGWHGAIVVGWMLEGSLPIIGCGAAIGIANILLLRQRGGLRFLVTLLTGLLVGFLCMLLSSELDLTTGLLNWFLPGFRRFAAGSSFATMVTSVIYYAVILLSVLIALAIRPRTKIVYVNKETQ